ncbi:MAG: hypothetical protein LBJ96_06135 [Holosporaceae bacterium]|jgi:hypothetical protein|nr:hypothetical protein [Holosporaceae bacterium]
MIREFLMHRKNLKQKLEQHNPEDETEIFDRAKMPDFINLRYFESITWKRPNNHSEPE